MRLTSLMSLTWVMMLCGDWLQIRCTPSPPAPVAVAKKASTHHLHSKTRPSLFSPESCVGRAYSAITGLPYTSPSWLTPTPSFCFAKRSRHKHRITLQRPQTQPRRKSTSRKRRISPSQRATLPYPSRRRHVSSPMTSPLTCAPSTLHG